MRKYVQWSLVMAIAITAVVFNTAQAASPVVTRITVEKMHCKHCARKMADQIYKLPGVAKVETNVEAKLMIVTPKPQVVLSPRSLWEAVEKVDYKPVKIEGPSGAFSAKPQS